MRRVDNWQTKLRSNSLTIFLSSKFSSQKINSYFYNMKTILVDMDGVLANTNQHFIDYEYKRNGNQILWENISVLLEAEAFPNFLEDVNSKGFFRTVPVIENAVKVLKYLNEKYNVLIVSSATEFPNSLTEKAEWLIEHFPFINWKQMIFCGRKDFIIGDIMIDDHPKNLNLFSGQRILFSQPHNANSTVENSVRVSGWDDIMNIL